ncbi:hypothetical protein HNQ51_003733 [Inhella inkyongensis]|uniref:Uncharacterized protein n=1 Tax=Inhella inkyongensis TaxID=392593 RepID=A0A840S4Z0_9BURK|nr:hypothetical protein [Inhella inkyongensis]MBB5206387.1 hypothetical protein [Inhella inkyongensis]
MKVALFLLMLVLAAAAFLHWRRGWRLNFISQAQLPRSVLTQLQQAHPDWSAADRERVADGLRQYFRICARASGRFVAMPSKAVDAAWHAFILDTRAYASFCQRAFGRMLHHTPAESLPKGQSTRHLHQGLRRAWLGACNEQSIDPHRPTALPLLFALDAELGIVGGYRYVPDCSLLSRDRGDTHCGSALACGGGDGGTWSSERSDAGGNANDRGGADGGDGSGGDGGD